MSPLSKLVDSLVRASLVRASPEVAEMEAIFQSHYEKFMDTDQQLSNLLGKMKSYISSLGAFIINGDRLTQQILSFYGEDLRSRALVEKMCDQQKQLRKEFYEHFERKFSAEVLDPVEAVMKRDVDEVKAKTDERNQAYAEVENLIKVFKIRTAFKTRSTKGLERRIKESEDRLALLQSEVLQRFDTVQRNFGVRLYDCVQQLTAFQEAFATQFIMFSSESNEIISSGKAEVFGETRFETRYPSPAQRSAMENASAAVETWDEVDLLRETKYMQTGNVESMDGTNEELEQFADANSELGDAADLEELADMMSTDDLPSLRTPIASARDFLSQVRLQGVAAGSSH